MTLDAFKQLLKLKVGDQVDLNFDNFKIGDFSKSTIELFKQYPYRVISWLDFDDYKVDTTEELYDKVIVYKVHMYKNKDDYLKKSSDSYNNIFSESELILIHNDVIEF